MSCYTCKWLWTKHQLCVSHRWCRHAYSWDQVDVSDQHSWQSHTISTTRFPICFTKGIMIKAISTIFFTLTLFAVFILFLKVANLFTLFYPFAWSNRIRKRTVQGEICTGKKLMTSSGLETGTFGTTHARKRRSSQLRIKLA